MDYYIEEIGKIPISNLPKQNNYMVKDTLLDLYFQKLNLITENNTKIWIQKNYLSGKVRIIIEYVEGELFEQLIEKVKETAQYKRALETFESAENILRYQNELDKLWLKNQLKN